MNKILKAIKEKKKLVVFTGLKMINAFIGLFINMFIVRKITVEEFGTYSMVLTVVGFLTTFGFSWSSSAITYFGARERSKQGTLNKTFWSRNYILLGSLSLVLLVFFMFGKQIENYIGLQLNHLLIVWLLIKIGLDMLTTYFLAIKEQLSSALTLLIGRIFFLLAAILLEYSLIGIIIINILCDLVGLLYILKIDKKDIGKPEFNKENFLEVFNFGLWQLFGFSGLYLINFGDNFVIKHFLTMEDVGIYNVAYRLFNAIAGLSLIFSSYYAPLVIEAIETKDKVVLKKLFYKERVTLILLLIIPHVFVIVFANYIITTIYGFNYVKAGLILQILMISSFISYINFGSSLIFNSLKKYKILQLVNLIQAIFNIVLNIALVNKFGIIGIAIASVISIGIAVTIKLILSEKYLRNLIKEELGAG